MIQLAKQLTQLRIIATASRPESKEWVRSLGADLVIDHNQSISEQLSAQGIANVRYVASLTHSDLHYDEILKVIKPQGRLSLIDDPKTFDAMPLKRKAISLHWELIFTRSLYQIDDMIKQHEILNQVAKLIDQGRLKTTLGEHYGEINAANLRRAHELIEKGQARGKIVLESFAAS